MRRAPHYYACSTRNSTQAQIQPHACCPQNRARVKQGRLPLSGSLCYNSAMTLQITPEQMAGYREGYRRRREQRQQALAARRAQAWQVARAAAALLKEQFGAAQVAVFGSLLRPEKFYERSDVDLAVWGLDEREYFKAVSRLLDLDPEISVDLVEIEFATPHLRAAIEQEGVAL